MPFPCLKLPVKFYITDDTEGRAGPSGASEVHSHTGELSSSAQVHFRGVKLQSGSLAVGTIPGLPVARYAASFQGSGLPIGAFKLPAQLQGEGGKAGGFTLDGQSLAGHDKGQRGRVDVEGRRLWVEGGKSGDKKRES